MRLTCPACGARYAAPYGAIPPEGRFVRCSACRAEWRVVPAATPPPPTDAPAPTAAPAPAPAMLDSPPPPSAEPAAQSEVPAEAVETRFLETMIEEEPPRRGGFMAGFALTASLCLAAVAVYAKRDVVAAAAPALAGPLEIYAGHVDRARDALAEAAARARAALEETRR